MTEWERIRVVGETERDAKRTKTATRAMWGGMGGGGGGIEEVVIRSRWFFIEQRRSDSDHCVFSGQVCLLESCLLLPANVTESRASG